MKLFPAAHARGRLKTCTLSTKPALFVDVESEKTAIICSAMMPQYLWLATGGKSGLTSERLSSLKGRKIIVFPHIDLADWIIQYLEK